MDWFVFFLGVFVGATGAILCLALCAAASDRDNLND